MEIGFLPQDYVVNAVREVDKGIESDFLVRAIRVKNTTSTPLKLKEYCFDIKIKGKTVKQVAYPQEMMEGLAGNLATNVKDMEDRGPEITQIFLGTERFWDAGRVSDTPTLKPNQEQGLLLEHFRVLRKATVDACVVTLSYTQDGKEKSARCRIPIVQYENKNSYIFPLKGAWLVVNNYDYIHVHRRMHSQEFAMDLMQLSPDFRLIPDSKAANEDYCHYAKEIYAIADGEVVSSFDGIPENPAGLGSRLPKKEWDRLKKKHGFVAWAAGNYVILKHSGDEYSFYAHMIPGSLTVKKGDRVKQGQVIGRVGNSGNSDAPHLHFHLMNGPSILSARGLPCRFSNLKDMGGEALSFIEMNHSIVHAE